MIKFYIFFLIINPFIYISILYNKKNEEIKAQIFIDFCKQKLLYKKLFEILYKKFYFLLAIFQTAKSFIFRLNDKVGGFIFIKEYLKNAAPKISAIRDEMMKKLVKYVFQHFCR